MASELVEKHTQRSLLLIQNVFTTCVETTNSSSARSVMWRRRIEYRQIIRCGPIRKVIDEVLRGMSREFDKLYAESGRPSIPPERLLRALLLQVFYSIRSERMLMEQLNYNLLFRWFVGEMDEPVWNHAVFSKNRERLLNQEVARSFFYRVRKQAQEYMSENTLSWASQKSFQKKDNATQGGDGQDFHGQKRSNDAHASKTDPDAKLYRKGHGQEGKLSYLGYVLMENRNGLIVDAMVTLADGTAERDAAVIMLHRRRKKGQPVGTRARPD